MIKAAFFDLDGTLVPYGEPGMSAKLREDLFELRRRGIKTILATGRGKHDLDHIGMLGDVVFDSYITFNGHCCYDADGFYRQVSLSREDLEASCRVLREHPEIVAIMEGENGNFLNQVNDWVVDFFTHLSPTVYPVRAPEEALDEIVYQVVPFIKRGMEDLFLDHMTGCVATRWHEDATDLIPKGNGKADGIRAALERYDLKADEIIAFGDGENDIPMLEIAGIGVAMGNAKQMVKDKADYVTLSVHDDGVCAALRHFGLLSGEKV